MAKARGLSPLEIAAVVFVAVALTFVLTRHYTLKQAIELNAYHIRWPEMEVSPLRERYGPARFSSGVEEWIIRNFFQDKRNGVFLDVGANHYRDTSNTYFLESQLGWSGVAVDALEEFGPDYVIHRPRTKFFALFVSDVPGDTATLFVPATNRQTASVSHDFTVKEGDPGRPRQVPTTTLNVLLEQQGIERLDLLSMDIELAEPKALAGFDIRRYRPALVCIESHPDVRQQILDYFRAADYQVIGKYLRMDPNNLYFRPPAAGE